MLRNFFIKSTSQKKKILTHYNDSSLTININTKIVVK